LRIARATEEPYHSRLARMFREGSDVLGKMVTEMYVRGLSTRDVENMFIQSWKGVRMSPNIWLELELLRREAFGEPDQRVEKELVAV